LRHAIIAGSAHSNSRPLVMTEDTERKLELLATACQSGRTVLLEGDTCSQKTALVEELACLTQWPLTVISLGSDTGEKARYHPTVMVCA
jgi:MoxR-like ATPase